MASRSFVSPTILREQMVKFYEKPVTRVSAELFFSIITVLLFSLFALRPTILTMTNLVKEIEDKRKIEEGLTRKIAALSTAQNEFTAYEQRFTILDTAYSADFSLEEALFYMEYLVAQEDISLASMRIDEYPVALVATASGQVQPRAVREGTVIPHSITLTFTGRYEEILRFLRSVERVRPLFSVQGFSLQRPEQEASRREVTPQDGVLSGSAVIFVYTLSEKKPEASERPQARPAPLSPGPAEEAF